MTITMVTEIERRKQRREHFQSNKRNFLELKDTNLHVERVQKYLAGSEKKDDLLITIYHLEISEQEK